ncbi:uncharacterized protein TNCV_1810601 [Trichonephila clavipes]|nr:uncharacterized protein TNCV_1810601 [Trichonephila clavipes]
MPLLDIAGVFVSGIVAIFRNIFLPQFSLVQGTAMVLYRITLSLIALQTVLRNRYQRLPRVRSLTFANILRNIEQLKDHLTLRVTAEKERRTEEDEVEKLAYQLNEEAERTERPIRRLSKVMYGSTLADMQVDVMGECLSSIKHVVGVRSVFLAKRLHAV